MSAEPLTFVDTSVLVYAYQLDDHRHEIARSVLTHLWQTGTGVLSTQVLQEFYVTVTRKLPKPLEKITARRVLAEYQEWPVQVLDARAVLTASEFEERYQLSFWDALIVVAAQRAGAVRLLSEDLQSGRKVTGVTIENPYQPARS